MSPAAWWSSATVYQVDPRSFADTDTLLQKFKLTGYDPHPAIKFKVAV